jgi:hypothetical protein
LLLVACVIGCSSGETKLVVQVNAGAGIAPAAVDVSVFDAHGMIGHGHVEPAKIPGAMSILGLADVMQEVRVVASGAVGFRTVLGGTRATIRPHATTTAELVLAAQADADGDGVPDALDDCPNDYDPMQESAAGGAPGDACRGGVGDDLAMPLADLANPTPRDLAGVDQAGADLATPPPPDMAASGSLCATAGLLLCDGFESGTIGGTWFINQAGGATISVDTTRAYRGTRSLKAHNAAQGSPGTFQQADIVESGTFAAGQAPTHFFVRAFVYIQSGFANNAAAIFIGGQADPPYSAVNVQLENGGFSSYNNLPNPAISKGPASTMPKDRWACLEWEIDLAGTVNLWVDGTLVTQLSGAQSVTSNPAMGVLGFGLLTSATANLGARDVWLDEIAVDRTRITCAK